MRTKTTVLLAMLLVLALGACSPEDPDPEPTSDDPHPFDAATVSIDYTFTDASVPPDVHRSFELHVTQGHGTVTVEVYGDTLATVEDEVDPAAVERLVDAYVDGDLDDVFLAPEGEPCDGGTSYGLVFSNGDFQGSTRIEVCGGEGRDLADQLVEVMAPVLEPFDVEGLTDGRYP